MNLYIKQQVFTWGNQFSIYDETGNERYYVEGEILTFGKKLHLYDLKGTCVHRVDEIAARAVVLVIDACIEAQRRN